MTATTHTVTPDGRLKVKLWVAAGLIAIGLVIIGYGLLNTVTNNGTENLPDEIENILPVEDAIQVPQQSQVVVDLESGYGGLLIIDGTEFATVTLGDDAPANPEPGQQLDVPAGVVYEVGNATLTFTPSPNAEIEAFAPGNHHVEVRYWKLEDGPDHAQSFDWQFHVV